LRRGSGRREHRRALRTCFHQRRSGRVSAILALLALRPNIARPPLTRLRAVEARWSGPPGRGWQLGAALVAFRPPVRLKRPTAMGSRVVPDTHALAVDVTPATTNRACTISHVELLNSSATTPEC